MERIHSIFATKAVIQEIALLLVNQKATLDKPNLPRELDMNQLSIKVRYFLSPKGTRHSRKNRLSIARVVFLTLGNPE